MTHKSEHVRQAALSAGWKAEVKTNLDEYEKTGNVKSIIWNLYLLRDHETIHIAWEGNRFLGGLYKYGDHTVKIWWRNELFSFINGKPNPAKRLKKAVDEDTVTRSVPWEHDSPAMEIMIEVLRKEIRWIRKLDGSICSAIVDVNLSDKGSAKHFRIYDGKNGRVLEWADALGFHAVALDQIIDVS